MQKDSKIYVAGHTGMVGSAITRKLLSEGYTNLIFTPYPDYDLTDQQTVRNFFKKEKPEYVFLAAAKVGGILANNKYRAQFIYENLMIQNNIIHESYVNGVKKLLFLGSSCIYPKDCPQPIKEEYLLTGELEYTNEPYAIAKIAGLKMCESYNIQFGTNFISVMPTNLYGPNDNYNLETSHVLPALIRKMHLGKCLENNNWDLIRHDIKKYRINGLNEGSSENDIIEKLSNFGIFKEHSSNKVLILLWGTGEPYREFMHVDDLADACVFLISHLEFERNNHSDLSSLNSLKNTHINIGCGVDQTISDLADIVKEVVDFKGDIGWDSTKPDGTYRKLLDISKIRGIGWQKQISLKEGINKVYSQYYKS